MGDSVIIPSLLVLSLALGTVTQLEALAQESADKTVQFADDATNALDCAYTARPLDECSPNLFSHDFKAEADETRRILEDLRAQQLGSALEQ